LKNSIKILWRYNIDVLTQGLDVLVRLKNDASSNFDFSKIVGPHFRHVYEHFSALLKAIDSTLLINYDDRARDHEIQSDISRGIESYVFLIDKLESLYSQNTLDSDYQMNVCFKIGLNGEIEAQSKTSLGRELLFLASHTIHHYALLTDHIKNAGLSINSDFGKAPSTLAFEKLGSICA
jgi:uncharacterized damage-inducible protein DinB